MSPNHENSLNPSPWIVRFAPLVAGPVLDVACGAGRHTRYFLARGHDVTAVDRDTAGLADLAGEPRLAVRQVDLEASDGSAADQPFGDRRFGGVVVTNYLWRPLLPAIVAAVDRDGVLLYETFAVGNGAFGKPSNPDYLLRPGELLDAVAGRLSVVSYEHGVIDVPRRAVVQRLCAVRANEAAPLAP